MTEIIITDPLERFLWGVLAAVFIIGAIKYVKMGRKKESSEEKMILYALGILFMGWAIVWTLWSFGGLLYPGKYIGHNYVINFGPTSIPLDVIGYIIAGVYLTLSTFFFERSIKRTKYILTIINIILFGVFLITIPILGGFVYLNIFAPFIYVFFIFMIFYLTKTASQEFKAISSIFLIGFVILMMGDFLFNFSFINIATNFYPVFLSPLLILIGGIIMFSPTYINPSYYSQGKLYWAVISTSTLILLWGTFIWSLLVGIIMPLLIIVDISYTILIIRTLFILDLEPGKTAKEGTPDYLKAFSRPQKLTEEEVSIAKEKQICLVCKNKLSGNIFLCSSCGAFYCFKCSDTLSTLENACWVCDTPFDESKPVKLPERDIEDVVVEEGIQKNNK